MERSFETATPPTLELRVAAGLVEVEAGAVERTEVRLEGPQAVLQRAVVEQRGETIVIDAGDRRGALFAGRGREVRLVVRCPAGASLAARTKAADVVVHGRLATADVTTASGDVQLEDVDGQASLKTASGDVAVRSAGGLVAATASGHVTAGAVHGPLRANLVSGDLRVDEADADVSASSVSGDLELRSVRTGAVRLQSVSGDVEVGIRRGSRVHVEAATLSGDTRSELELASEPGEAEGPLVELLLKSVSGDLVVVRAPERAVAV